MLYWHPTSLIHFEKWSAFINISFLLERMCVLLLCAVIYKLGNVLWYRCSSLLCPYWLSSYFFYQSLIIHKYLQICLLLLLCALFILKSVIMCKNLGLYILLMNWSLCHCDVTFCIPCNNFIPKHICIISVSYNIYFQLSFDYYLHLILEQHRD